MDDLDGIINKSFVSNSIREARGLLTMSISKPQQPDRIRHNRNLFAVESERTRKREKSCNIDTNMRATAHSWNKVFTSSIGFNAFNQSSSGSGGFTKTLSTSSLVSNDNDVDYKVNNNINDFDDIPIGLEPKHGNQADPNNSVSKTNNNNLNNKNNLQKVPKSNTMKLRVQSFSSSTNSNLIDNKENVNDNKIKFPPRDPTSQNEQRKDKKEREKSKDKEDMNPHDENYIKKYKQVLSLSKDICKNYNIENEMKLGDKVDEVSNIMTHLLGNRSLVSQNIIKKQSHSKLVICLRNLLRFKDIDIMLKIITTMIHLQQTIGEIFDSTEASNDFYCLDPNLIYCFKLMFKQSKNSDQDLLFKNKKFMMSYINLFDLVIQKQSQKVNQILKENDNEQLMEFNTNSDKSQLQEKQSTFMRYRIEPIQEFLLVALGFLKNLTQSEDSLLTINELNIQLFLEPVMIQERKGRQIFSPQDTSVEQCDVLIQLLGVLANIIRLELDQQNFLQNNWVHQLTRVICIHDCNEEVLTLALTVLATVSTDRNVASVMFEQEGFTKAVSNAFENKDNNYLIFSNAAQVLTNLCTQFPECKKLCWFSLKLSDWLPRAITTVTDKLLICLETTSVVSEKQLGEVEDATSKLLNLTNTLMMEQGVADNVLQLENLLLDVVDLLNCTTENTELILTVINFTSIISFQDKDGILDLDTKASIVDALKIYLTNMDKHVLVEAMRAVTNLTRDPELQDCICDPLVLRSLQIIMKHADPDVIQWVLAVVVNLSCNQTLASHSIQLEAIVESIFETIQKWQNEDSETAILGVMNLINLSERDYPFSNDHLDTLLEVKNTCTLQHEDQDKIMGFQDELLAKLNKLDDQSKDFKEIFQNLDEYIKSNIKHKDIKLKDTSDDELDPTNANTHQVNTHDSKNQSSLSNDNNTNKSPNHKHMNSEQLDIDLDNMHNIENESKITKQNERLANERQKSNFLKQELLNITSQISSMKQEENEDESKFNNSNKISEKNQKVLSRILNSEEDLLDMPAKTNLTDQSQKTKSRKDVENINDQIEEPNPTNETSNVKINDNQEIDFKCSQEGCMRKFKSNQELQKHVNRRHPNAN